MLNVFFSFERGRTLRSLRQLGPIFANEVPDLDLELNVQVQQQVVLGRDADPRL